MNMDTVVENVFHLSEEEQLRLGELLFEKNYSSEALSFMDNHLRTLSYWGSEVNILPPTDPQEKRRKYSFVDLVWLGVVRELRRFGMEKDKILVLKEALYSTSDSSGLLDLIKSNRKRAEALLMQQFGANALQIKTMVDYLLSKEHDLAARNYTHLYHCVMTTLVRRVPFSLLITPEGDHCPFDHSQLEVLLQNDEFLRYFRSHHLSVSLSDVVSFFLSTPYIQDDLKQRVFTPEEWNLIEHIRKEKPLSIKVDFSEDGRVETIEVTRKVYASLEQRLSELIAKGTYGKIEVLYRNGQPVFCTRKQTFKQ